MHGPSYHYTAFCAGCAGGPACTIVSKGAQQTARSDFGLNTAAAVLEFVAEGGLESPSFISSSVWLNNPDPANTIMVDSYDFHSGPTLYGYIAFLKAPTGKWLIKSFKKNDKPDPRPNLMHAALLKAGLIAA